MLKIIRYPLLGIYCFVVTVLGVLLSMIRPFNPDNVYWVGRMFGAGIFHIMGMRVIIEGREVYEDGKSRVYIGNHQTNWDIFLLGCTMPRPTVGLGKKEIAKIPLFGLLFRLSGNILIDRGNRKQARQIMGDTAKNIRHKGTSVMIFPEGTRNRGAGLQSFKKGAFYLALDAGVPLVPVCVNSYANQINFNRWRSATIVIKLLDEVRLDDYSSEPASIAALTNDVRETMLQEIQTLDERLQERLTTSGKAK